MIRFLPLIAGTAPILGVSVAYWLNVRAGVLPGCMPLLDGCTSISATGRYAPGSLPFRAVLLPQAVFLVVLWWTAVRWLNTMNLAPRSRPAILLCGVIGAVALILYVMFLGTSEPFYEFMRRFGIYFYFLGTALAQVLLTRAMPGSRLRSAMLTVIATPFILGLLNLLQKPFLTDADNVENRIEWIAALLMQVWFLLFYVAWRRSVSVKHQKLSD